MTDNPYQSPTTYQPAPEKARRRTNRWGIATAMAWIIFVALFLPAAQVLPCFLRLVLTLLCVVAAYGLVGSVRGWRHLLVLPFWLLMLQLNYLIWTHTFWTADDWRDWRRQRIEERQRHRPVDTPVSETP